MEWFLGEPHPIALEAGATSPDIDKRSDEAFVALEKRDPRYGDRDPQSVTVLTAFPSLSFPILGAKRTSTTTPGVSPTTIARAASSTKALRTYKQSPAWFPLPTDWASGLLNSPPPTSTPVPSPVVSRNIPPWLVSASTPASTAGSTAVPVVDPVPITGTDPIQGLPGPDNGEPKNLTPSESNPFIPGNELCFSTDSGRKKRATSDTDATEIPLKTTIINYIEAVIASLDGDKCPSKALLEPPLKPTTTTSPAGPPTALVTNEVDVLAKRSAPLTKRQPQTLSELIKLVISVYNECPTEGYRKRAFRPYDLGAYTKLRHYQHQSEN